MPTENNNSDKQVWLFCKQHSMAHKVFWSFIYTESIWFLSLTNFLNNTVLTVYF